MEITIDPTIGVKVFEGKASALESEMSQWIAAVANQEETCTIVNIQQSNNSNSGAIVITLFYRVG